MVALCCCPFVVARSFRLSLALSILQHTHSLPLSSCKHRRTDIFIYSFHYFYIIFLLFSSCFFSPFVCVSSPFPVFMRFFFARAVLLFNSILSGCTCLWLFSSHCSDRVCVCVRYARKLPHQISWWTWLYGKVLLPLWTLNVVSLLRFFCVPLVGRVRFVSIAFTSSVEYKWRGIGEK